MMRRLLRENYETFMKDLGQNVKDMKFRKAIRSLARNSPVKFAEIEASVAELLPTQNEIDVDKSLKWPLTNVASAEQFLFCGKNPVKVGNNYIITAHQGLYIVDGHHRWSQVYSINPKCNIAAIDLIDLDDPIEALKATQFGIAAGKDASGYEISTIPSSVVLGKNLLTYSEADVKEYVNKMITADVMAVFKRFDSNLDSKEKIGNYIWGNVKAMQTDNLPVSGAPGRGIMPQTDLVVNWRDNLVNVEGALDRMRGI